MVGTQLSVVGGNLCKACAVCSVVVGLSKTSAGKWEKYPLGAPVEGSPFFILPLKNPLGAPVLFFSLYLFLNYKTGYSKRVNLVQAVKFCDGCRREESRARE